MTNQIELDLGNLKDKDRGTCATCKNLVAVQFNARLYFCSAKQGGRYGKKIRKNDPGCRYKVETDSDSMELLDGCFGGSYGTIKR